MGVIRIVQSESSVPGWWLAPFRWRPSGEASSSESSLSTPCYRSTWSGLCGCQATQVRPWKRPPCLARRSNLQSAQPFVVLQCQIRTNINHKISICMWRSCQRLVEKTAIVFRFPKKNYVLSSLQNTMFDIIKTNSWLFPSTSALPTYTIWSPMHEIWNNWRTHVFQNI